MSLIVRPTESKMKLSQSDERRENIELLIQNENSSLNYKSIRSSSKIDRK
jgi:hypothetical protein